MTCQGDFHIRWAGREDAAHIARLFLISSDGLAAYIWSRHARPGEPPEDVGTARYMREGVEFSYENCLLATQGSAVLGMVHAFEMTPDRTGEPEKDPVLAPYGALEDPGSLYISGLAVYASYRGAGIGGGLLDSAEELAVTRRLPRQSLICFERNTQALGFYFKRSFRIADRRQLVPHPCLHYHDGDAFLMVRSV